jgi:hypothetical protein
MNFCGGGGRAVVAAWVAVGCVGAACVVCAAGLLPDEPQAAAAATVAMAISASAIVRIWSTRRIWSLYLESDPWAGVGSGLTGPGSATLAVGSRRPPPCRRGLAGVCEVVSGV